MANPSINTDASDKAAGAGYVKRQGQGEASDHAAVKAAALATIRRRMGLPVSFHRAASAEFVEG